MTGHQLATVVGSGSGAGRDNSGDDDNGCHGGSAGDGNNAGEDIGNDNLTFCSSIGIGYDLRMRHNDIPNSPYKGPQ